MAVHAGTVVMTPFGKGIVRNIRKDGGVDVVHLPFFFITVVSAVMFTSSLTFILS
jgi:hypothetical protein